MWSRVKKVCYNIFMIDKTPPTAETKEAVEEAQTARMSASRKLSQFLTQEGIVLVQDVSIRDVKTVSDGSIIIDKPALRVEYK